MAGKNSRTNVLPVHAPASLNPGEVFTLAELCARLGRSRKTVLRWCTDHGLKDFSTRIGASWFVTTEQFAKWIESQQGSGVPMDGDDQDEPADGGASQDDSLA